MEQELAASKVETARLIEANAQQEATLNEVKRQLVDKEQELAQIQGELSDATTDLAASKTASKVEAGLIEANALLGKKICVAMLRPKLEPKLVSIGMEYGELADPLLEVDVVAAVRERHRPLLRQLPPQLSRASALVRFIETSATLQFRIRNA